MCGILFSLQSGAVRDDWLADLFRQLQAANTARGPDAQDTVRILVRKCSLTFFASELRLRGDAYIAQPHRDTSGNILCWNGEIFGGIDVASEENDGAKLFSLLQKQETAEGIRDCLGSIEGPYAVVYYQHSARRLFFARDPLGRRSLLIHRPMAENPYFLLCSVSIGSHSGYTLEELSTHCIYVLDIARLRFVDSVEASFEECLQEVPRYDPKAPSKYARLDRINVMIPEDPPKVEDLARIPEHLTSAVDELLSHLDLSVRLRVQNVPRVATSVGQARVAVLFSGGIDSTMLAFLAHRHVDPSEPIDLLNVAFENPRKICVKVEGNIGGLPKREKKLRERIDYSTVNVTYGVPDRLTGLLELEELRRLCPGRVWNFVEINVPFEESQEARPIVEALMFPSRTVMDLSLAVALYFAARGIGQVRSMPDSKPVAYVSPARVLLNGLGSDELLGGYGRFRTCFKVGGWQAIIGELQLELDRIPMRNLGRDDRVISSRGKETRHPFLSLSVVSFLAQLPVHLKTDPRLESGLGEKMLLRLAARKVGLVEASSRKKRAMQFGSHSARMSPGEGEKKGGLLIRWWTAPCTLNLK
ncbi:uncharacterized protein LAESUDRAFT_699630 [Laetiporus sulphureus 93-53]|uniref:Glutamine amidotransferase type-2 domain-containing protein n=1 Tax=Laetiporus sulphureus 93-53 TaxID=1314785 RepID=A0A165EDC8_9APHY|nr:uncharacterized protein LAESUDRAFT_699630 [Laetiporus sulphureus 93-53]KZT06790.1 hypothetical protein LAESUDRAFT_699630 [Laetiporus sulphureus 93-53]